MIAPDRLASTQAPAMASAVETPNSGQPVAGEAAADADVPVLDQDGKQHNFYGDLVRGRTVALQFISTTCTTYCLPLAANFRQVQQQLGARIGADLALISISIDP